MQTLSVVSSAPLVRHEPRPAFRAQPQPGDPENVARLIAACGVFTADEARIARELVEETLQRGPAAGYSFLFAEEGARFLAYTCFGPIPGTDRRFELFWIAVDPAERRFGLGRRLMAETEAAARAQGAAMLIVETSMLDAYAPTRAFYLAQGYELKAEVPDYHRDGDGLAIFTKRL